MATTIKDVASLAGVSTATVSRVLTGKNPVGDEARRRVLSSIEYLGYRPNVLARSLRAETTKTIGLVVSNVMNPFFTSIARAVEDTAGDKGYSLILGNADENPSKEDKYIDILLGKRVDGLIVSPARAQSPRLTRIVDEGVPMIFLDRSIVGIDVPVVRADGTRAVRELVDYIVKLGHERLAIISGPPEVVSGRERLDAFMSMAGSLGVPVTEDYVKIGDFRRKSGREAMRELLELRQPPTVVFASNNLMALGALQAVKEGSYRVPEDISLAGFDDVSWFELMSPPITTIGQPTQELGSAAIRMLIDIIENGQQPESQTMEAELIIRGSCREPYSGFDR